MKTKELSLPCSFSCLSAVSAVALLLFGPVFCVKKLMKHAMMDFHHAMNRYCNYFPCAVTSKVIKSVSSDFKPGIVIAIAAGRA